MKSFKMQRIIWAIDPFDRESGGQQALTSVLEQFSNLDGVEIQPVYISKAEYAFLPLEKVAYEALREMIEEIDIIGMNGPKIFKSDSATVKSAVDALIKYSREVDGDLIVTQTHGRQGVRRLVLGSFAETLLMRSPIPVLTINPYIVPSQKFQRILFPTDFDHHAVSLFKQVVAFAKAIGGRIILHHIILTPILPYAGDVGFAQEYESLIQDYTRRETEKANKHAKAWTQYAAKEGVPLELALETNGNSIWEHIIHMAEKHKVKLIALETKRGPTEAAVFGSITRNLSRYADCPVLVLSSHYSEHLTEQTRKALRKKGSKRHSK